MPQWDRRRTQRVFSTCNRIRFGTTQVGTTAIALTTLAIECFSVSVKAAHANTANVLVGNNTEGCHWPLAAGEEVDLNINLTEKVFVRSVLGTQVVHWKTDVW